MKETKFKLNLQLFADGDPEPNPTNEDPDLIEALAKQSELLKNSVPKDELEKVQEDKRKLLDIILNGRGEYHQDEEEKDEVDLDALRATLFSPDKQLSNLDYVSNTLKLRKEILERDGYDIFVQQEGYKNEVTQIDVDSAERVAQALQDCVDSCDGDSGVFTAKLSSLIEGKLTDKRR